MSVTSVSCSNDYYIYNLATDMIRETDVVYSGGYITNYSLEDVVDNDSLNVQVAEIHSSMPYFSWMIVSNKKNTLQSKYRILVASSRSLIDSDTGDVWDSGMIESSMSTCVPYGGTPLEISTVYYWKVCVVDNHGRKYKFSEPKGFLTASEFDGFASVLPLRKQLQHPKSMNLVRDTLLLDFGNDDFGQFSMKCNAFIEKDCLTLHIGEQLLNGHINSRPCGEVRYVEYNVELKSGYNRYKVEFTPNPRNTDPNSQNGVVPVLMPSYIGEVLPFRYVQVDNYKNPLHYNNFSREVVYYPFDTTESFFYCSDTVINKVWNLCKHTLKATTFAGVFVDGDRERVTYEGDTYINELSYFAVSSEYSIVRNTLERLLTHSTWPTEWMLIMLPVVYNYYLYTGDINFLRTYYDELRIRTLSFMADSNDYLLYTGEVRTDLDAFGSKKIYLQDIIDWPPNMRDDYSIHNCNSAPNAFYYNALNFFSKIADILDNKFDAERFYKLSEKVKHSFNKAFLLGTRLYADNAYSNNSSLHSNMMPLAFGLAPDSCCKKIVNYLLDKGMKCSPFGAQFLLDALFENNGEHSGVSIIADTSMQSWYGMLRRGSTMTTEVWNDQDKSNADWNHPWGTAPTNVIMRKVMGIEPLEAGFGKVRICPKIGYLTSAVIKVPTPKGAVEVSVSKESKNNLMIVTIPANMTAEVWVPGCKKAQIIGSGRWEFYYGK